LRPNLDRYRKGNPTVGKKMFRETKNLFLEFIILSSPTGGYTNFQGFGDDRDE